MKTTHSQLFIRSILLFLFFISGNFVYSQIETNITQPEIKLEDPVKWEAYYDYQTGNYILYPKIGNVIVGTPVSMTSDEYTKYVFQQQYDAYNKQKANEMAQYVKDANSGKPQDNKAFIPGIKVKSKVFESIFGGDKIELKPQGFASFDLGILYQKIDNPQILPQNRQNFTIDLRQRIQLSLIGYVGKNLSLKVNYDTQAGFAFENKMNLTWKPGGNDLNGGEDNIIKKIDFGNVSMPLSTSLITGAQSLFGVKAEFQFGKTYLTTVFSEQQSEAKTITVQNGGLVNTFKINATGYEENQHYFSAHYFRDHYDSALLNYPIINSTNNIITMEVWKIDNGNTNLSDQRAVLAVRDLGEKETAGVNALPDNNNNNLYNSILALGPGIRDASTVYQTINNASLPDYTGTNVTYQNGEQFITHKKARKLSPSEYTYNAKLGYISLNQKLTNDQLLAVAYRYTDLNGTIHKVGDIASESTGVLILKLLKPNTTVNTASPMWDLMMKNIYSLDASNINSDNFILNVIYKDPSKGKINYLPDPAVNNAPLLQLLNWDRLNGNGDSTNGQTVSSDGQFDFMPDITINPDKGKVMFTKVEPFGSYLTSLGVNPTLVFSDLYTKQKSSSSVLSNNLSERYFMEGRYKGTVGSGISLGALNVPRGSVTVTANGQTLTEGVDYVVDYQMGSVTILNDTYKNSGVPVSISLENQSAFNMQKKRFFGINVEHKFSDEFSIGATYLNYKERPLTQKVQYGYEPVNNSMVGFNMSLNKETPFLTKFANWFPGVKTDAKSNLSFKIEGAYLIPGENDAINDASYIDDFEESSTKISLKDPNYWGLASKPSIYNPSLDPQFANGDLSDDLKYGYGRGLMSWYYIDTSFYGLGNGQPAGIDNDALSLNMQRRVKRKEVFTSTDLIAGDQIYMNTFDVSFFPNERGPYNFNPAELDPNYSDFENRWGGLMRPVSVSNFTEANIEYIEFWMMDPYADAPGTSLGTNPEMLLQLGNVSEDVLKDGYMMYENGLPTPSTSATTTTTNWGIQPQNYPLVYAFSTEGEERKKQDVGYDGLDDADEATKFGVSWLNPLTQANDPAADNFVYYTGDFWDNSTYKSSIVQRYKYFRNPDGNSPSGTMQVSSALPDSEDINGDYNMDESENFNQYRVNLSNSELSTTGNNFIVDQKSVTVSLPNGHTGNVKWYQFRIPVSAYETGYGSEENLSSVRFVRLLLKGFSKPVTLRFASLDLVRSDWRTYPKSIAQSVNSNNDGLLDVNTDNTTISSVNIEENSTSTPPYMTPPGIVREELSTSTGTQKQNEASLRLEINNLTNDSPRGIYKNSNVDLRRYGKLKAFIHAEDIDNPTKNDLDKNAKFFIRLGIDLSDNYYEYEMPLTMTSISATGLYEIWPEDNNLEIDLNDLVSAKLERDRVVGYDETSISSRYLSTILSGEKAIYVKGRPSVGNVTSIMMGVRNTDPSRSVIKNLILWVNELRLTDISNEGGGALLASLNGNLADFAQFSATGSYRSVGFGALDSKPSERSQDEEKQYSVSATVNVDKMLPEKWGVKLPVSVNYSESFIDPKYNPLDNDVKFKDDPRKDQLKEIVRTYSAQKTVSVTNFRKERTNSRKKPRFYDVENLSASFLYSDTYYRDVYTKYNLNQRLNMSLDYNFNTSPKYYQPFRKWGAVQDTSRFARYLKLVKEVNFNPVPTRVSFQTNVIRTYNEYQYRDINSYLTSNPVNYAAIFSNKFLFSWQYNIGFNFSRSFKLDFYSQTQTIVDDLGNSNPNDGLIWKGITNIGRPINYNQRLQANYKIPVHLLPFMDFTSLEVGYTAQYDWTASSTYLTSNTATSSSLGNTAQNSRIINVLGNLDFSKLYANFKSFKNYEGRKFKRQREIDSLTRVYENSFKSLKRKPFKNYTFKTKLKFSDYIWMVASSFKRGQIQYTKNNGTLLPGFLSEPNFFGQGSYNGSSMGPTLGFLFGSQFDIKNKAITEGWLSTDPLMTDPYTRTSNSQLSGTLQIEPFKQLLVDLNITKNTQKRSTQTNYILNPNGFRNETGLFSATTISIATAFKNGNQIYSQILTNSKILSRRVAMSRQADIVDEDNDGYIDGFGISNSEVLIPSFVSAFRGSNASSQKLGYRLFPLPNWKLSYGGLKNIPFINYLFKDINISHGYVSTYTVNGIQSNTDYFTDMEETGGIGLDSNGNRYNYYTYGTVVMAEGFSPLIGADLTLRNNMQIKISYNRDRTSMLSITNLTLQEDQGNEIIFGLGYIIKDVKLNMRYRGAMKSLKSDINIRADFSIRDNQTTIRKILENYTQITGGQRLTSLKLSVDYNFSKNFNLKFFYDQQMTKYKISTAYPISTIRAGLSATLTFN